MTALSDVESNIRSLRNYVDAFQTSTNATQEFEVLPEIITLAIHRFRDDVDMISAILPPGRSVTVAQRFGLVYNQKKVREIIARLQDRRSNLTVALSLTGR